MAAYAIEGFREICIKGQDRLTPYMASTQSFKKSSIASFVDLFSFQNRTAYSPRRYYTPGEQSAGQQQPFQ